MAQVLTFNKTVGVYYMLPIRVAIGSRATVAMSYSLLFIHHSSSERAVVTSAILSVTALRKSAATVGGGVQKDKRMF